MGPIVILYGPIVILYGPIVILYEPSKPPSALSPTSIFSSGDPGLEAALPSALSPTSIFSSSGPIEMEPQTIGHFSKPKLRWSKFSSPGETLSVLGPCRGPNES
jgi:hypothetical protein